uniref:Uncharacterized protein n=1 Tax=Glossina palpalis gambiensis TaxID=67801 RepID=A0A1B0BLB0_9MUSC
IYSTHINYGTLEQLFFLFCVIFCFSARAKRPFKSGYKRAAEEINKQIVRDNDKRQRNDKPKKTPDFMEFEKTDKDRGSTVIDELLNETITVTRNDSDSEVEAEIKPTDMTDRTLVTKNRKHNLILTSKYLRPAFAKAKVHEAFHQAYDIFYAAVRQHIVERDTGKRVQATVVARLGFFKQEGSCGNGSIHRINLFCAVHAAERDKLERDQVEKKEKVAQTVPQDIEEQEAPVKPEKIAKKSAGKFQPAKVQQGQKTECRIEAKSLQTASHSVTQKTTVTEENKNSVEESSPRKVKKEGIQKAKESELRESEISSTGQQQEQDTTELEPVPKPEPEPEQKQEPMQAPILTVTQDINRDTRTLSFKVAQTTTPSISCSAELTVHGSTQTLSREPEKPTSVIEHREANTTHVGGTATLELQCKGFP